MTLYQLMKANQHGINNACTEVRSATLLAGAAFNSVDDDGDDGDVVDEHDDPDDDGMEDDNDA